MDRVKRKWLLLGSAFLISAAIWLGYHYLLATSDSTSPQAKQAVKASLKDIELVHGQGGHVVWRLKASSSHMSREGETIFFQEPRLRYLMENGTEVVQAASAQGSLDRELGRAIFWPDVAVRYQDMDLKAGRMVYTANQKELHFSQGVAAKGSAIEIYSKKAELALYDRVFIFEDQAEVLMYETPKER
jgi:hypothetical protein